MIFRKLFEHFSRRVTPVNKALDRGAVGDAVGLARPTGFLPAIKEVQKSPEPFNIAPTTGLSHSFAAPGIPQ